MTREEIVVTSAVVRTNNISSTVGQAVIGALVEAVKRGNGEGVGRQEQDGDITIKGLVTGIALAREAFNFLESRLLEEATVAKMPFQLTAQES
jgi:hypothetical protein